MKTNISHNLLVGEYFNSTKYVFVMIVILIARPVGALGGLGGRLRPQDCN
jgi:hypothetical protein